MSGNADSRRWHIEGDVRLIDLEWESGGLRIIRRIAQRRSEDRDVRAGSEWSSPVKGRAIRNTAARNGRLCTRKLRESGPERSGDGGKRIESRLGSKNRFRRCDAVTVG